MSGEGLIAVRQGRTLHVHLTKDYLLQQIAQSGARGVLKDWPGTDAEAIAAVRADPRECFVVGPCDRQGEDGHCLGHPREAEQEIGGQQ